MSSISLSRALTAGTPYEWHDAVALVAQLVSQTRADLKQAPSDRWVPDLSGIALEADGTLALRLVQGKALPAMPGAAQLLQQLLTGLEQPTPLWLYVTETTNTVPAPSIDEFGQELTRWERPNRQAKLAAFHDRASVQVGGSSPKATAEPFVPPKVEIPVSAIRTTKTQPDRTGNRRRWAVASVVLAGIGAGAAAWFAAGRSDFETAITTPSSVNAFINMPAAPSEVPDLPPVAVPPTAPQRGPRPAPSRGRGSAAQASEELERARRLFDEQQYSAATERFTTVLDMLQQDDTPQARELRQISAQLAEQSRTAAAEAAAAGTIEYRAGDPGVVAAVPRSILPAPPRPGVDPARLEVLELHIDERGDVASAHFVMKQPSFRNRWMVSAAKAWRFEPATKDGRPVPFVARVLLDDRDWPQ